MKTPLVYTTDETLESLAVVIDDLIRKRLYEEKVDTLTLSRELSTYISAWCETMVDRILGEE